MQNVKKSLSIKILASFTLFFLLISIFANYFERKDKIINVSAADDVTTTYTYNSSNIYIPIARLQSPQCVDYLVFKVSLVGGSNVVMNFDCDMFYNWGWYGDELSDMNNYYYWSDIAVLDSDSNNVYRSLTCTPGQQYAYFYIHDGNYGWKYIFYYHTTGNFNGNVNHIRLDSFIDNSEGYNRVTFYCSDNDYLTMFFSCGSMTNNNGLLATRDYYLNNPSSYSDNENYNFGYSAGYNDGYNTGNSEGNSNGYKNGYDVGVKEGYNNGYGVGVENAGKYTFTNLLGAVIDVPVRTFTNLFNFELLGVNLAGFFSGLLTLAVILTIVRLIKGG